MLTLPRRLFTRFLAHARAGLPEECCALLGGTRQGEDAAAQQLYVLTNTEHSHVHYSMDPAEQFAAVRDMRKNGWELLGNLHSHPETPSRPSEEDKRLAFDPALRYLILSLMEEKPVLRCFRIRGGDVTQEPIKMLEESFMAVDYGALKKGGFMRQKQKNCFSMRLRMVAGHVTADQLKAVYDIANKFGKGYVHLTARQGIEIPFIRLEDIDEVKKALQAGGLEQGACGARVRTVTACQGSAICPSGLIETQGLAKKLDARYFGKNLPHKFKLGITGCKNNCLKAEENDLGIKGGMWPTYHADACTHCGLCAAVCPAKCIAVDKEKKTLVFDETACVACGRCVKNCPTDAWTGRSGYVLSFGGNFGNNLQFGKHLLPIIFEEDRLMAVVDATISFFQENGRPSERFSACLNRVGFEKLRERLEEVTQ